MSVWTVEGEDRCGCNIDTGEVGVADLGREPVGLMMQRESMAGTEMIL